MLYFREVAGDNGTAHGLLGGGASFVVSSSLSDPSLRLEVADLEELNQRNCEYPSLSRRTKTLNLEIL